jgi:hypothetical protein
MSIPAPSPPGRESDTDAPLLIAMATAYKAEAQRARAHRAPAGEGSYESWVTRDCFRAVLRAVRDYDAAFAIERASP